MQRNCRCSCVISLEAGGRVSCRPSGSLVEGSVGHLRNEFQARLSEYNYIYILLLWWVQSDEQSVEPSVEWCMSECPPEIQLHYFKWGLKVGVYGVSQWPWGVAVRSYWRLIALFSVKSNGTLAPHLLCTPGNKQNSNCNTSGISEQVDLST